MVVVLAAACGPTNGDDDIGSRDAGPTRDAGYQGTPARNILVRLVLDGDTIIVDASSDIFTPDNRPLDDERIRLLGIDAPEIAHNGNAADCWGDESHEFLRSQIQGRTVDLEYDTTRCRPGSLDRCRGDFGRLLAYVKYRGRTINEEALTGGHARVLGGSRFRHRDSQRYDTLEGQAQSANAGMWSCP